MLPVPASLFFLDAGRIYLPPGRPLALLRGFSGLETYFERKSGLMNLAGTHNIALVRKSPRLVSTG